MTTTDITVHGIDEAELITALPFLRGFDDIDQVGIWQASEACLIDVIGNLEGYDGFYMNLRCDPGIAAQIPEMIITEPPATLRRWF